MALSYFRLAKGALLPAQGPTRRRLHREPEERHLKFSLFFLTCCICNKMIPILQTSNAASPLSHLRGPGYLRLCGLSPQPRHLAREQALLPETRLHASGDYLLDGKVLENKGTFWCPAELGWRVTTGTWLSCPPKLLVSDRP